MAKRKILTTIILCMVAFPAFASEPPCSDSPPPPDQSQYFAIRDEIDRQCQSAPPADEDKILCFIDQVHIRHESQSINDQLFGRLLREGDMRMAFRRGFVEGYLAARRDNGGQCTPPPRPHPQPSPSPTPAPGDGNEKVTLCHKPSGDESKAHTIRVGASAVDAHLAHGDSLGACPNDGSDKSKDGKKGKNKDKGKSKSKSKSNSKSKSKK